MVEEVLQFVQNGLIVFKHFKIGHFHMVMLMACLLTELMLMEIILQQTAAGQQQKNNAQINGLNSMMG